VVHLFGIAAFCLYLVRYTLPGSDGVHGSAPFIVAAAYAANVSHLWTTSFAAFALLRRASLSQRRGDNVKRYRGDIASRRWRASRSSSRRVRRACSSRASGKYRGIASHRVAVAIVRRGHQ